jgi:hypothetical protein
MTKAEFTELASLKFDKYASSTGGKNLYDYEAALSELMQELGQSIMEKEFSPEVVHQKKKKKF